MVSLVVARSSPSGCARCLSSVQCRGRRHRKSAIGRTRTCAGPAILTPHVLQPESEQKNDRGQTNENCRQNANVHMGSPTCKLSHWETPFLGGGGRGLKKSKGKVARPPT